MEVTSNPLVFGNSSLASGLVIPFGIVEDGCSLDPQRRAASS